MSRAVLKNLLAVWANQRKPAASRGGLILTGRMHIASSCGPFPSNSLGDAGRSCAFPLLAHSARQRAKSDLSRSVPSLGLEA